MDPGDERQKAPTTARVTAAEQPYGIVFIMERIAEFDDWSSMARFFGHWEIEEPTPRFLEDGPGWENLDEAVEWGRERAAVVMLRLGRTPPQQVYSAGTEHPYPDAAIWSGEGREA